MNQQVEVDVVSETVASCLPSASIKCSLFNCQDVFS